MSRIEIQVEEGFLPRGRTITVPIVVKLEQTMRARGIYATFHAAEETKATYTETTRVNGKTRTRRKTATQTVDIVRSDFLLDGHERLGCFAGLMDSFSGLFGGGKRVTYQPGEQHFEIEIEIPENSPQSFRGERCRVYYEITANVDRPLCTDVVGKVSLHVDRVIDIPPANPVVVHYPEGGGRGFLDKAFGKDVRMSLALDSDSLTVGDHVKGLFQAEADSEINMKSAKVRLVCEEKATANGHSDSHRHELQATQIPIQEHLMDFSEQFDFIVDVGDAPPSSKGTNFTVSWFVEAELDVPWAKNARMRAPIFISY